MSLMLRNPHSVLAAYATRPLDVLEVHSPAGMAQGPWAEVLEQAARFGTPVLQSARENRGGRGFGRGSDKSNRPSDKQGREGAALAVVRERAGTPLEELFAGITPQTRGLWLALDCLQDPHNVGAIFRTAAFFGVRGVVVTRDRSAPLSSTVYDVASGGLEVVPYAQPVNLVQTLNVAKDAGLWLLGTSEHASRSLEQIPVDRPWMLVVGNEEHGLRRLTLDRCDEVAAIRPPDGIAMTPAENSALVSEGGRDNPKTGAAAVVGSLNVSVATAIAVANLCQRFAAASVSP